MLRKRVLTILSTSKWSQRSRDDIRDALAQFDPQRTEARRRGPRRRQLGGELYHPGARFPMGYGRE